MEFGAYAQTHETHTNDMQARTIGAICLGPSGNEQGGHYFMSLATGECIIRHRWTPLPLPADAATRVSDLGRQQAMPRNLTFADRFGSLVPGTLDDLDDQFSMADASDSDYDSDDHSSSTTSSHHTSYHSDDDDDNDPESSASVTSIANYHDSYGDASPHRITGVDANYKPDTDSDSEANYGHMDEEDEGVTTPGVGVASEEDEGMANPEVMIKEDPDANEEVDERESDDDPDDDPNDAVDEFDDDPDDAANNNPKHNFNLRPRKPQSYDHRYDHQFLMMEQPFGMLFVTEQMSLAHSIRD
jgi:hypothetical protein